MVLIPKGSIDTRGISLLETLWRVVEALIDTTLCASLHLHDVIHGFRAGRGMGMAVMDMKPDQELPSVYHGTPFLVFIDLRKV